MEPKKRVGRPSKGELRLMLLKLRIETFNAIAERARLQGVTRTEFVERAIERELKRKP
jgi:hypothetical protein